MNPTEKSAIQKIAKKFNQDRGRLMDVVHAVQDQFRHVSPDAMITIAEELKIQPVEVRSLVSFYAFFSEKPKGKVVIRLCNDVVDKMQGVDAVGEVLKKELGLNFGETTPDGSLSLEWTPCIGMCDQAPAALVNEVVVTRLTPESAKKLAQSLKSGANPKQLVEKKGDGNNGHALVGAMVENNIKKEGAVIFAKREAEAGLNKALSLKPEEVIKEVKESRIRGRGGAGFPTGMKWEFTRSSPGSQKYILCNADEGEPGTFKDRVLLTEKFELLIEGMTIGGYAIGATEGIIYLRGEYRYLKTFLEANLQKRRESGLLGKDILKKPGFQFDVRIQLGAGAYICGEESALISSCEGLRGDPKIRPPFPSQKGYKGCPTSVNNVETLCGVARIMEQGATWFQSFGSTGSSGTKLLSVSGDCQFPGVYEFPFGIKVSDLLNEVGAKETQAVLMGGPSGHFIGPDQFNNTVCYDDYATGGAIVVVGAKRDLLDLVHHYMEFFVEESCGHCTPCRAGNVFLKNKIENILSGHGEPEDLTYLTDLGHTIKKTSRCGLGQTSPNPILTTISNFKGLYESKLKKRDNGLRPSFDIKAALEDHEKLADRTSEIFK